MKTGAVHYFVHDVARHGLLLLCFWCSAGWTAPSVVLENQIAQIRLLAESQTATAITIITALKARQPASASLDDQRFLLNAMISLVLNDDRRDAARALTAELSELGSRFNDPWTKALVLNYQAMILRDEAQLVPAGVMIREALQLAKVVNVKSLTRQIDTTFATIDSDLGNFSTALQYQLSALNLLNDYDLHDNLDQIQALSDIGKIYVNLKDPRTALRYFEQGYVLAEKIDAKNKMASLTLNRGVALTGMEKVKEAIGAYTLARKLAVELSDRRTEMLAVNNLADSYHELGNYTQGLHFARQTLELAKKLDNEDDEAGAMVIIGLCHIGLGEIGLGGREVAQGIARLRLEGAKTEVEQALGQLAQAYARVGQYRDAYEAIAERLTLSTELFKIDRDRVMAEMGAKYDASEREKQIALLERKTAAQSAEIRNKGLEKVLAILSTIVAAAIIVIILLLYRKVKQANQHLKEANLKLAGQSNRDPLTGLYNRRAFLDFIRNRTELSNRRAVTTDSAAHALVMLDIDHFKRINDRYGHASGDAVLIELSQRLAQVMRDQDMLMRWGGEEFLIFLSHVPEDGLAQIVERILNGVGGLSVVLETGAIAVTISAGYISLPLGTDSEIDRRWERFLNLADAALYIAKTRGRNQAIGIQVGTHAPLDAVLSNHLDDAILLGLVQIDSVAGPFQSETIA